MIRIHCKKCNQSFVVWEDYDYEPRPSGVKNWPHIRQDTDMEYCIFCSNNADNLAEGEIIDTPKKEGIKGILKNALYGIVLLAIVATCIGIMVAIGIKWFCLGILACCFIGVFYVAGEHWRKQRVLKKARKPKEVL